MLFILTTMKFKGFSVVLFSFLLTLSAYAGPEYDALMDAILVRDLARVSGLLSEESIRLKIDLNERNHDGWTPLTLASAQGSSSIASMLLESGASLKATARLNGHEYSPFILVAMKYRSVDLSSHPIVQTLLSRFSMDRDESGLNDYERERQYAFHLDNYTLAMYLNKLGSGLEGRDPSEKQCPICLDTPGSVGKVTFVEGIEFLGGTSFGACGNEFCTACLTLWVREHGNCPDCRKPLPPELLQTVQISSGVSEFREWQGMKVLPPLSPRRREEQRAQAMADQESILGRFRAQFVQVPAGQLPDGTQIAAMQADRYPVTRELWNEIMGGMPAHFPAAERPTWNASPRIPVTYVNWENENGSPAEVQDFLARLNVREQDTGCVYGLPTDKQLWYLIRGDETGHNQDLYSAGVTAGNVNEFVTHWGNSGHQIQPVGNKTPNRFGIELGNVWKMSKELYDPAHRNYGRSVRGGGWGSDVYHAESGVRYHACAGDRDGYMGVSLVRTCP